MRNKALCKWLRSGVVIQNMKTSLESTLDSLFQICKLNISREKFSNTLKNIITNDKTFRDEHPQLIENTRNSNVIENLVNINNHFNIENNESNIESFEIETDNESHYNYINVESQSPAIILLRPTALKAHSPPPVRRIYSFSEAEQGAVVESFTTIAEKTIIS
ncbi:15983_t:CDS:2, partial [Gigaspora rosea]